ncbi:hypothetical protein VTK26DRAFT_3862 [Humicola hyalothermophila]
MIQGANCLFTLPPLPPSSQLPKRATNHSLPSATRVNNQLRLPWFNTRHAPCSTHVLHYYIGLKWGGTPGRQQASHPEAKTARTPDGKTKQTERKPQCINQTDTFLARQTAAAAAAVAAATSLQQKRPVSTSQSANRLNHTPSPHSFHPILHRTVCT